MGWLVTQNRKIVLVAMLVGCVAWLSRSYWLPATMRDRHESESASIAAENLDFGETWESNSFHWPVIFQNHSTGTVQIEGFGTSCDCVRPNIDSLAIPSGEQRRVEYTLDLTKDRPLFVEHNGWPASFQIGAKCKDSNGTYRRLSWNLHGTVKSVLSIEPEALSFGDSLIWGCEYQPRTATVRVLGPVESVSIANMPGAITCQLTQAPHGYKLKVAPSSKLSPGNFNKDIYLEVHLQNSKDVIYRVLPVSGSVTQKVVALPQSVRFGAIPLGQRVEGTITLNSRTAEIIKSVDAEPPSGMTIERSSPKDAGWLIQFRQDVAEKGEHRVVLDFRVRLSSNETLTLPISISWFGMSKDTGG